jgi:hypothetical protein
MNLTQQEVMFINMINYLNTFRIRYWITFTLLDSGDHESVKSPYCIYITYFNRETGHKDRGYHNYTINISSDNSNMKNFNSLIRRIDFFTIFPFICIKDNTIHNHSGYDYIKSTTHKPFYIHLQSNYVLNLWCRDNFGDYDLDTFEREFDKLIHTIFYRDFARTFINIKNVSVKIITPRLKNEKSAVEDDRRREALKSLIKVNIRI